MRVCAYNLKLVYPANQLASEFAIWLVRLASSSTN